MFSTKWGHCDSFSFFEVLWKIIRNSSIHIILQKNYSKFIFLVIPTLKFHFYCLKLSEKLYHTFGRNKIYIIWQLVYCNTSGNFHTLDNLVLDGLLQIRFVICIADKDLLHNLERLCIV